MAGSNSKTATACGLAVTKEREATTVRKVVIAATVKDATARPHTPVIARPQAAAIYD